jgi:2-methylisocitrate lyase-like PEP mutase family enzyme
MIGRTAPLPVPDAESGPVVIAGAPDVLSAYVLRDLGYRAVYVSGAGLANSQLGLPDLGLLTLTELADQVERLSAAVDLPVLVDGDTGFGGPLNVRRAVRMLERRGASAIQLEDQVFPKRCGHFEGKEIVARAEMLARVRAAVDARTDERFQIIARTDARATDGLGEALDRALAYKEVGADILFVEAPESVDEIEEIATELPGPLLINIVEGGKTPQLTTAEFGDLGYSYVLYANSAMRAAMHGVRTVMAALLQSGTTADVADLILSWNDRQTLVRKDFFERLEDQYRAESDPESVS